MKAFEIESAGIFNSQVFRPNIKISDERKTRMFEFELPIEQGGISYIEDRSEHITPSIMICAKPGQARHTRFPFKCYYIHINIYDSEIFEAAIKLPDFVKSGNSEEYVRLFKLIIKYRNSSREYDKYMTYSCFLRLLHMLIAESDTKRLESRTGCSSDRVNTAIGYIADHLTDRLTLESVAYAVHSSPIYFHNCFKEATGKTLHTYIEEKRIEKSVFLMQTTDMTLAEIAYACGFSSQSYYSYAFKRHMKTTPRKHLAELNNNYEI